MQRRDPRQVLADMLQGRTNHDQSVFRSYLDRVGPTVSWYPSSGHCFRDILIWNWDNHRCNFPVAPDIFIHTDYRPDLLDRGQQQNDGRTAVQILPVAELCATQCIQTLPEINQYGHFCNSHLINRRARLLEVTISSDTLGELRENVLFCEFDNIDFISNFSFHHGLAIDHIFKLREGCGFGGCTTSMTFAYAFVGLLGCRSVIADTEIHFNRDLYEWHNQHFGPGPAAKVTRIASLGMFSGFEVNSHAVDISRSRLADWTNVKNSINEIAAGGCWEQWDRPH